MFTGHHVQTTTYLLAVCPFSIAFLVFMNSSISFVVSDLLNIDANEGDAVGTLGFADELLALVACPLWGVISDRIGARYVCTIGYAVIALSLVLFVQASNVYPQLLLGRLLFCIGGSAVATMVTAILPSVTADQNISENEPPDETGFEHQEALQTGDSESLHLNQNSSENTHLQGTKPKFVLQDCPRTSAPKLAGFVGMFTGCGALLALLVFLPLSARFEKSGYSAADAIKLSFYLVAAVALAVSAVSFFGLRGLRGDEDKSLKTLFNSVEGAEEELFADRNTSPSEINAEGQRNFYAETCPHRPKSKSFVSQFAVALKTGFTNSDIGFAYIGGFVARSSSVGISLFIPLYINKYYRQSGLCHGNDVLDEDIKKSCPKAYIAASILTGISQLVALLSAPIFGYLSSKSRRYNFPLIFAALAGILGYLWLSALPSWQLKQNIAIFINMALIGISQIGSIVCSLAILSNGISSLAVGNNTIPRGASRPEERCPYDGNETNNNGLEDESSNLLPQGKEQNLPIRSQLYAKGSIAGMYSLWGGAGILILTKLGGLLFDKTSPNSPFYILAAFNGLLLCSGAAIGLRKWYIMG